METSEITRIGIQVRSAVPTFVVADVGATAAWYAERLGFSIAGTFPDHEPYGYASLQRDQAEIMLLRLADFQKPDLRRLGVRGA